MGRRLALGGSYDSGRLTGNCRPATGKTQQGQADVCHLRRPESGQVRTRGRTRLNRFLVELFPCLACSHRHFDFDSLCSHVSDLALEPRSHARAVEYLYRPVAARCSCHPRYVTVSLSRILSFASVSIKSVVNQQSNTFQKSSILYPCPLSSGLLYSHSALHYFQLSGSQHSPQIISLSMPIGTSKHRPKAIFRIHVAKALIGVFLGAYTLLLPLLTCLHRLGRLAIVISRPIGEFIIFGLT